LTQGARAAAQAFSTRTLLWFTLAVAAFLGGVVCGKQLARQEYAEGCLELEELQAEMETQRRYRSGKR